MQPKNRHFVGVRAHPFHCKYNFYGSRWQNETANANWYHTIHFVRIFGTFTDQPIWEASPQGAMDLLPKIGRKWLVVGGAVLHRLSHRIALEK